VSLRKEKRAETWNKKRAVSKAVVVHDSKEVKAIADDARFIGNDFKTALFTNDIENWKKAAKRLEALSQIGMHILSKLLRFLMSLSLS
jgi:hypothetical protein